MHLTTIYFVRYNARHHMDEAISAETAAVLCRRTSFSTDHHSSSTCLIVPLSSYWLMFSNSNLCSCPLFSGRQQLSDG